MGTTQKIEALKQLLAGAVSETERALALIDLLKNSPLLGANEVDTYLHDLEQLAQKSNSKLVQAWSLLFTARSKRSSGNNKGVQQLIRQALNFFTEEGDTEGQAMSCTDLGAICEDEGLYADALDNNLKALGWWKLSGDKGLEAEAHNNIGTTYESLGNCDEALNHHVQALVLRQAINDKAGIAASLNNIGNIHQFLGNYGLALKNFNDSLEIVEAAANKKGMAIVYNNIGIVYYLQGKYPESLKNHLAALHLREEVGDRQGIACSYNNIGVIHYNQNNFDAALKNNFLSLEILEQLGEKYGIADAFNNIGNAYEQLGNYAMALEYYFKALDIKKEIGDPKGMANAYNSIGAIYEHQQKYDEALINHQRALELGISIGEKRGIAGFYNSIGQVYQKQGRINDAISHIEKALSLGREIGSKQVIKESCLALFNVYKAANNFQQALQYHEMYHQVESEMLGEAAQKQLTDLNFEHNFDRKEKELEIEQLRNVELKKERDRSESLLLNILPGEVAEELKEKGTAEAKLFDNVTVLYTDFVSFTEVSQRLSPQQLVDELHQCFSAFDEIMMRHKIEKIKTIGDAYMAVSGLPQPDEKNAENIINAAKEVRDYMAARRQKLGINTFDIRIGINSGSVVAGIVGLKKYAYDIWGDTVNTAARMEQNSLPGKINISESTFQLIKHLHHCEYRGEIEAKNKGKLKMYFVE